MFCSVTKLSLISLAIGSFVISATGAANNASTSTTNTTCADPNDTITFYQGWSQAITAHVWGYISDFSSEGAAGVWQLEPPMARIWITAETGTVPVYRFYSPTATDYMFVVGASDGTIPTVPGYEDQGIWAYAYPTQICGSVPLYAMSHSIGDHWYTTNLFEKNRIVQFHGYTDLGILAYVLPVDCSCTSN